MAPSILIVGLLQSLIAAHNMDPAARMDRRVTIRDGQVTEMA